MAELDADIMSVDELYSAFEKKKKALRNAVLGSDGTLTRSGFIDTSKGSVVTSARAFELARYKRNAGMKKLQEAAAKDARKQAQQDRRARSAAEDARHYRNERVRRCAALSQKRFEEFSRNMRSMTERRAVCCPHADKYEEALLIMSAM